MSEPPAITFSTTVPAADAPSAESIDASTYDFLSSLFTTAAPALSAPPPPQHPASVTTFNDFDFDFSSLQQAAQAQAQREQQHAQQQTQQQQQQQQQQRGASGENGSQQHQVDPLLFQDGGILGGALAGIVAQNGAAAAAAVAAAAAAAQQQQQARDAGEGTSSQAGQTQQAASQQSASPPPHQPQATPTLTDLLFAATHAAAALPSPSGSTSASASAPVSVPHLSTPAAALAANQAHRERLVAALKGLTTAKGLLDSVKETLTRLQDGLVYSNKPRLMAEGSKNWALPLYPKLFDSQTSQLFEDADMRNRFVDLTRPHPWSKPETLNLRSVVRAERKRMFALECTAAGLDLFAEIAAKDDDWFEQSVDPDQMNWERIAEQLGPTTRTALDARINWVYHTAPGVNTADKWTKDENERLAAAVEKLREAPAPASEGEEQEEQEGQEEDERPLRHGFRAWEEVAAAVGNGRTPWQCFRQHRKTVNRERNEWDEEADKQLRAAVKIHGRNWGAVALTFTPARPAGACALRYKNHLDPSITRSRWTADEDEVLRTAVAALGASSWPDVAARVPGRTAAQCRERWVARIDPNLNFEDFTPEEDKIVLEGRDIHNKSFPEIAKIVGNNRNDNMCLRRYHQLKNGIKRKRPRIDRTLGPNGRRVLQGLPKPEDGEDAAGTSASGRRRSTGTGRGRGRGRGRGGRRGSRVRAADSDDEDEDDDLEPPVEPDDAEGEAEPEDAQDGAARPSRPQPRVSTRRKARPSYAEPDEDDFEEDGEGEDEDGVGEEDGPPPAKRTRHAATASSAASASTSAAPTVKRRPGRPRKHPLPEPQPEPQLHPQPAAENGHAGGDAVDQSNLPPHMRLPGAEGAPAPNGSAPQGQAGAQDGPVGGSTPQQGEGGLAPPASIEGPAPQFPLPMEF